jgi:hypothetical protein
VFFSHGGGINEKEGRGGFGVSHSNAGGSGVGGGANADVSSLRAALAKEASEHHGEVQRLGRERRQMEEALRREVKRTMMMKKKEAK